MQEGTLVAWLIEDGATVTEGQPLFTLELEKSTMDVESPGSGVLKQLVPAGSTHKVGAIVGEINAVAPQPSVVSEIHGNLRRISQVVPDLDSAIRRWARVSGAGPFLKIPSDQLFAKCEYQNAALRARVSMAIGKCGDTLIELVQMHDDHPSAWRDAGIGAITPVISVHDIDAMMAAEVGVGADVFCTGTFRFGGRFCFLRSSDGSRCMVVERHFVLTQIEEKIAAAHRDWDRRDWTMQLA